MLLLIFRVVCCLFVHLTEEAAARCAARVALLNCTSILEGTELV